jgi:methylenetetrahydrofolate dehydrogenase (NADP+)/methenyltetrahydrofolate cyclohydrolase
MTAQTSLISGKQIAQQIKDQLKQQVADLDYQPGLAVILVGENPASQVYVRAKDRACQKVGFYSQKLELDKDISQEQLLAEVQALNQDPQVDGILVQLPLPDHLDEKLVIDNINPDKDVDVFHPANVGRLSLRKSLPDLDQVLAPCTPKGVMRMLEHSQVDLEGKQAVVVGRSNLVGKPLALMLLARHATVTVCHSRTKNLQEQTKQADVLIAAVGRPEFITQDMVKPGAVVIDVGINRTDDGLVGDVAFDQVKQVAGQITPVPGGVGPMTIASLLENTLLLAKRRRG